MVMGAIEMWVRCQIRYLFQSIIAYASQDQEQKETLQTTAKLEKRQSEDEDSGSRYLPTDSVNTSLEAERREQCNGKKGDDRGEG